MRSVAETSLDYLAGIVDVKGQLLIPRMISRKRSIRLRIVDSERGALDILCRRFGGSICVLRNDYGPLNSTKKSIRWEISGAAALNALAILLPRMPVRGSALLERIQRAGVMLIEQANA